MKSIRSLVALMTLLALTVGEYAARAADVPAKERAVILVSLDGFPAWMCKDPALPCPNLRRLAKEGSVAEAMTVSNPSITWINHTTMITGVEPRKHGVLFNGLLVRNADQPPKIEPWRDRRVASLASSEVRSTRNLSTNVNQKTSVTT